MFAESEFRAVADFYSSRRDLVATPLVSLPALASKLGIGSLLVKDESRRFGMPAFKAAGAMFALHHLLAAGRIPSGTILATASAGNHGRAVAHIAKKCGFAAKVYLSARTSPSRIAAIAGEGAETVLVDGGYDDALRRLVADAARENSLIFSDTSSGLDKVHTRRREIQSEIPRLIMLGYTQIVREAAQRWQAAPDIVFLQAGVGSFAAAITSWLRFHVRDPRPTIVCCEPSSAACVLESARAGKPAIIDGPFNTKMAGLRCAEITPLAWEPVQRGMDAFVAIDDAWSEAAMRTLARPKSGDAAIEAGESGAAGLGALLAIAKDGALEALKRRLNLTKDSRVLVFNTEGATDPENYAAVLARPDNLF